MYTWVQARQQSVEEVNQRWAAKSHTLLSRIANLEQQLQGQGNGQGQSGTSPDAQVRHQCPACCRLALGYSVCKYNVTSDQLYLV